MTLKESIELNEKLGVKHTPELKSGDPARINAIFGGQETYAQKMIDTLVAEGVDPKNVWLQSFDINDVLYWIKHAPAFGKQAVYLDDVDPTATPLVPPLTYAELREIRKKGVRIFAPPMPALLARSRVARIRFRKRETVRQAETQHRSCRARAALLLWRPRLHCPDRRPKSTETAITERAAHRARWQAPLRPHRPPRRGVSLRRRR